MPGSETEAGQVAEDFAAARSKLSARALPASRAERRTAAVAGWLMASTFITSIAALALYDPVLNDTNYILGTGDDARVTLGALSRSC